METIKSGALTRGPLGKPWQISLAQHQTKRKTETMKKLVLVACVVAGFVGSSLAGWRYSGLDGQGHWVTGHWDNNGNYSGLDGNGHWITGHINNGYYSGLDGNGNWVTGTWTQSPY